jgi:hypothetical protein
MDEDFLESIQRDSEQRKADPLPFALEALADLFGYVDYAEEGFQRFQRKMASFFWWADDAVQCLELVLADPPAELGQKVRDAGVVIWIEGGSPHAADAAETEQWLREACVPRLRSMFDDYVKTKTEEQLRERDEAPDG